MSPSLSWCKDLTGVVFLFFFLILQNDPCTAGSGKEGGEILTSGSANGLRRKDSAWSGTGGFWAGTFLCQQDRLHSKYK